MAALVSLACHTSYAIPLIYSIGAAGGVGGVVGIEIATDELEI